MDQSLYLLLITVISVVMLLTLVMKFKLHAFVSLLLVSSFVGLAAGMPFNDILTSIEEGMGSILGFIAIIVGLGTIIGKLLEVSGGAEALARNLTRLLGEERTTWSLTLTGFIVSIPVFFDVAFILLVPIIYALSRKYKRSTLYYAIPLMAGGGVAHTFIPPTPGPTAVAEILGAPLGWVIIFGALVGIPTAIVAGPLFGRYISKKIHLLPPDFSEEEQTDSKEQKGDFFYILLVVLLPLILIVLATIFDVLQAKGVLASDLLWVNFIQFIGHPFSALTITTLFGVYFLGYRKGFSASEVMQFSDKALAPAGLIILVTGAGGVFKQILIDSGVGDALAQTIMSFPVAPIALAWILAVVVRVTQGSATVAMITAAGLVAPLLSQFGLSDPEKALYVIAIAAGAMTMSHVNDSGFWLVSKYLGMTEKQTLKSWSVMTTIISVMGFCLTLLIYLIIF